MERFSLTDQQVALLGQGIIDFQGKIDDEMFQYVRDALLWLAMRGNPPIRVQISSNGGRVETGLAIYDMLRLYPKEITGVVIGYARSMATIVLQACTKRHCMKNSFLVVHEVYRDEVNPEELTNPDKLKKLIDYLMGPQVKLYQILEERTGKSRDKIVALCHAGNAGEVISAGQALEFGLIDTVL